MTLTLSFPPSPPFAHVVVFLTPPRFQALLGLSVCPASGYKHEHCQAFN